MNPSPYILAACLFATGAQVGNPQAVDYHQAASEHQYTCTTDMECAEEYHRVTGEWPADMGGPESANDE